MEKELLDKFTNFVNWCIELNVDFQKNPEKYEGFLPFKYVEIGLMSRDKVPYSFQRKKFDLFNAELIPELIKGNDKKICGNIFTYSIRKGFQESI